MKRYTVLLSLLSVFFLALSACGRSAPAHPTVILATTTSTQDSGLLDVLVPLFEAEFGYRVQTIAVGTGAALKMAEEGNADVLLVHAPEAEKKLMEAGWGKERWLVMYNDFVIVGPASNPAEVQKNESAAAAFGSIADTNAIFISRGDDSGTHKKEKAIWGAAAITPQWDGYFESGQGMAATLLIASEKQAYTLTDRATFLANQGNLNLSILVEGEFNLLNIYHVITVNPEKWTQVNAEGALAFAQFITRPNIQTLIGEFGVEKFGQPLFVPAAGKTEADLAQ